MGTLTGLFGYSRQAFYKHRENKAFANEAIEPLIVEKARDLRESNPGLGCVKLYLIIKNLFESTGSMPGRDAFIEIMRKHGLMVQIKRRRHYKTTDSDHPFRKYDNLIRDIVPSRPNEIWVSDITYVETEEGVCYLSLVTDAYSHRIMGWAIGPTLETCYPLAALKMALSSIDGETSSWLIHHSDRGCQYCSYAYVKELKKHNIMISMTQSGDPLENAIAAEQNADTGYGRMPHRTAQDHRVLQHPSAAPQHRHENARCGPPPIGPAETMLAQPLGGKARAYIGFS